MRCRDWWIGIVIVAGILLLHALFPRYEVARHVNGPSRFIVQHERWTGRIVTRYADDLADEWHERHRQ